MRACIVTCGGLCPGINTVIREIVCGLNYMYDVNDILGIQVSSFDITLSLLQWFFLIFILNLHMNQVSKNPNCIYLLTIFSFSSRKTRLCVQYLHLNYYITLDYYILL